VITIQWRVVSRRLFPLADESHLSTCRRKCWRSCRPDGSRTPSSDSRSRTPYL